MISTGAIAEQLCLACGLCCDGTLFKDVQLQAGDSAIELERLGLAVERLKTIQRFPQPCAALCDDRRCRIYAKRPVRCHDFECGLFVSVGAGRLHAVAALRVIRTARQRAERVRRLLRELGDGDESTALSVRFRRMQQRFETGACDESAADLYGLLSLAVHDLNVLLSEAFYPGKPEREND